MATEVTRGFEVFVPQKTLNYEKREELRTRFWTGACLQIVIPTEEEPDWGKIKSAFEEMMTNIAETKLRLECSKPNDFIDFCEKRRKNFPAPPSERIYES